MVFVFGSNEAGAHGGGAARTALQSHGAEWGVGVGRRGESYALPTLSGDLRKLPLERIAAYVRDFFVYAREHAGEEFQVTQIGCGIAAFTADEIAPLFAGAPPNCLFDRAWEPWLPGVRFWGTFS